MHRLPRRRFRTIAAWLACVAMLAHAWVSAYALAAPGRASGTVFPAGSICSLDSAPIGVLADAPVPTAPEAPAHSDARHCAWCVVSHAPVGAAPMQRAFPVPPGADSVPAAVRAAPLRRVARLAAHSPRAPPLA